MLKSLEKLRQGLFQDECDYEPCASAVALSHEIEGEIEKYYIPRPVFESGEPVQEGDFIDLQQEGKRCVKITGIEPWIVYGSSTVHQSEPYKRADSYEQIDDDVYLNSTDYCNKYQLQKSEDDDLDLLMRKHLLDRQRKLDGVQ